MVGISLFKGMGRVRVIPDAALPATVIFASWKGAVQENSVRSALEEAGLHPVAEPVGRWKDSRSWKYLLPSSPLSAARAVGQIFRTGYGLGDLTPITIWCHEARTA